MPKQDADFVREVQGHIDAHPYGNNTTECPSSTKDEPLREILRHAKQLQNTPTCPVKCVEAVFLAIMKTQGRHSLLRIPVSFRSQDRQSGRFYSHLVLAVNGTTSLDSPTTAIQCGRAWGCIGHSRESSLAHRNLSFLSLDKLLQDFRSAYDALGQTLVSLRLGLPVPSDVDKAVTVCWRYTCVEAAGSMPEAIVCKWPSKSIEKHQDACWDIVQQSKGFCSTRKQLNLNRRRLESSSAFVTDTLPVSGHRRTQKVTVSAADVRTRVPATEPPGPWCSPGITVQQRKTYVTRAKRALSACEGVT